LAQTLQKNEPGAAMRLKTARSPAGVPVTAQGVGTRAVLCRSRSRLATGRDVRVEWRNAANASAQPILMHPGGAVPLNESAALLLELCNGTRSLEDVLEQFVARSGDPTLAADAREFLEAARQRGWIVEI
jgi:pyrroloquinoline quinone biosynthesis protein D